MACSIQQAQLLFALADVGQFPTSALQASDLHHRREAAPSYDRPADVHNEISYYSPQFTDRIYV